MFTTEYRMLGGDNALKSYQEEIGLFQFNGAAFSGGRVERQLTTIPYATNGEMPHKGESFSIKALFPHIIGKRSESILFIILLV